MKRLVIGVTAGTSLLGACSVLLPAQQKPSRPLGVAASARPSVKPTGSPRLSPSPAATPAGPTVRFSGTIEVDAFYLVAAKAGTLVSNNGSTAIALKAGSLISPKGLGILSDNGLGLLSNNGLGLIANNGGSLVSNNGAGFRVLAGPELAVGTILPVKGMAVIPLSMRTGEVVGAPVFTDARGAYALDLPERLKGSVRIVARVPVATATDPLADDPRLQYNLVVAAPAATPAPSPSASAGASAPPVGASTKPLVAGALNEDTAVVTKFMRQCFAHRFKQVMTSTDVDATTQELLRSLNLPDLLRASLKANMVELNDVAREIGLAKMPAARAEALIQLAVDALLSYAELDTLRVDLAALGRLDKGYNELALAGLTDVLGQLRDGATRKMQQNPAYFETEPYVIKARRQIRKPADLCDMVVEDYLLGAHGSAEDIPAVFEGVAVPRFEASRLNTLNLAVITAIGQVLLSNGEAKRDIIAAMRAAAK